MTRDEFVNWLDRTHGGNLRHDEHAAKVDALLTATREDMQERCAGYCDAFVAIVDETEERFSKDETTEQTLTAWREQRTTARHLAQGIRALNTDTDDG